MQEEGNSNLWIQVGRKCLGAALSALEKEPVPTQETVETVRALVDTAIAIDKLNIRWAERTWHGLVRRLDASKTAGVSEREHLIQEYERRLALLKGGASPGDVTSQV